MTADRPEDWERLRVSDADFDADPDAEFDADSDAQFDADFDAELRPVGKPAPTPDAVARPGLPLRWCAALAGLGLVAAITAFGFAAHRSRTITVTRTEDSAPVGADAAGCPATDSCSTVDGVYGSLAAAMDEDLPASNLIYAGALINPGNGPGSRAIRVVRLTGSGATVAAIAQCDPSGPGPMSRSDKASAGGATLVVIVRADTRPGCGLAVLARIPGAEPAALEAALHRLAADPVALGG